MRLNPDGSITVTSSATFKPKYKPGHSYRTSTYFRSAEGCAELAAIEKAIKKFNSAQIDLFRRWGQLHGIKC